jgi:hypothetical protein
MAQLTFAECQLQIQNRLSEMPGGQGTSRLASAIAMEVLSVHNTIPEVDRRVDADLFRQDRFYAIPDETLDLVPSLIKAACAVIAGNPAHALPDLVGVLYRYRMLQVVIDADEAAVIGVLRAAHKDRVGPLSAAEIGDHLNAGGLQLRRPLKEVLASIEAKKTEKATLANESNGRWTIGNV